MNVYRFTTPYDSKGKPRFKERNRPGVYLIAEDGDIVYIGSSCSNLYSTMLRHFQEWNSQTQEVVTYVNKMRAHRYTVRIVLTTASRALKLEIGLIDKYEPRDNINGIGQTRRISFLEKKAVEDYLSTYVQPPDDLFV